MSCIQSWVRLSLDLRHVLTAALESDNTGIFWDKVTAKFIDSSPGNTDRSSDATKERFKKMQDSYRYLSWILTGQSTGLSAIGLLAS